MQEFGKGPNKRRPKLFFGTDFSLPPNNAPEIYLSKGFYALIYLGNREDFNDKQTLRDTSAKISRDLKKIKRGKIKETIPSIH